MKKKIIFALCAAAITPSIQGANASAAQQSQLALPQQMPALAAVTKSLNTIKTLMQGSSAEAISAYGAMPQLRLFLCNTYQLIALFAKTSPLNTSLDPLGKNAWDYISTNAKTAFSQWNDLAIDTNTLKDDLTQFCNAISARIYPIQFNGIA